MRYVDNYSHWLNQSWIKEALEIDGFKIPYDFFKDDTITREESQGIRQQMDPTEKAVYDVYGTERTFFHLLERSMFSFDIVPPWVDQNKEITWWMTKMYPGQYIPTHKDVLKKHDPHNLRYWMPLQDYEPGHIFIYEDRVITNYKAGDVFVYSDPRAWHGAINIGKNPRLVLQITTFDNKDETRW